MSNRYYQGPPSDHFDGKRFFHPGLPQSDKTLLDILRWKILGKRSPWPRHVPTRDGLRPKVKVEALQITAIGHASLLIQFAGTNILLDPVWSQRVSPFRRLGPVRRNPPAVAFADLPPIDTVLLTHNHYDHLDLATIKQLWEAHRPLILTPLGNDTVIHASAPQAQVQTGDWWESFPLPHGIRANIVPSYHWSSRGLGDRRMALWGGFVLKTPECVIYCSGDTAYRDGKIFQEIRERFGAPAVAIVPIGAYEPRWFMRTQHTNPEEAVQIALDLGAPQILGIHWDTFSLTDEPYNEPAARFNAAARSAMFDPANAIALHPGDTFYRRSPAQSLSC
jgi:L-ascorbate metabolism protein UlaG (beta-lactamase superfamily)